MRLLSDQLPVRHRTGRTLAASAVAALGIAGLSACGDSAGPEEGVATADLTALNEDMAALDERVATLEEDMAQWLQEWREAPMEEQAEVAGQTVTVGAEVSEVITTTDVGGVFRIAGDQDPSVAVLATTPPEDLGLNDTVQVTGTVVMVQRDTFEEDFGIAEDELFDDPEAFFAEAEGQPAIAATEIDVIDAGE